MFPRSASGLACNGSPRPGLPRTIHREEENLGGLKAGIRQRSRVAPLPSDCLCLLRTQIHFRSLPSPYSVERKRNRPPAYPADGRIVAAAADGLIYVRLIPPDKRINGLSSPRAGLARCRRRLGPLSPRAVAYHETCHAVVARYQGVPITLASIIADYTNRGRVVHSTPIIGRELEFDSGPTSNAMQSVRCVSYWLVLCGAKEI